MDIPNEFCTWILFANQDLIILIIFIVFKNEDK